MRKTTLALAGGVLAALSACSEPVGDADACDQFHAVREEVSQYTPSSDLSEEEKEAHRQWEFRLAEASVQATDHDLSIALRRLADVTAAVTYGGAAEMDRFTDLAETIETMCE